MLARGCRRLGAVSAAPGASSFGRSIPRLALRLLSGGPVGEGVGSAWDRPFIGPVRTGDAVVVMVTGLLGIGYWYMSSTSAERDVGELQTSVKGKVDVQGVLGVLARGRTPVSTRVEALSLVASASEATTSTEMVLPRVFAQLVKAIDELAEESESSASSGASMQTEAEFLQAAVLRQAATLRWLQETAASACSEAEDDERTLRALEVAQRGTAKLSKSLWDTKLRVNRFASRVFGEDEEAEAGSEAALQQGSRRVLAALLERYTVALWACASLTQAAISAHRLMPPAAAVAAPPGASAVVDSVRAVHRSQDAARVPRIARGAPATQFTLGLSAALGRADAFDSLLPHRPLVAPAGADAGVRFRCLPLWDAEAAEAALAESAAMVEAAARS